MDKDVEDFLTAWGFEQYIEEFKNQKIDSAALTLLTDEHVKEIIKPIGDRAKFLANLNAWRNVLKCVNEDEPNIDDLPLFNLLKSTNEGKAILKYKNTGLLDNSSRNKLCDLIIRAELQANPDAVVNSVRLLTLATQICQLFCKEHKSTYFIPYLSYGKLKKAAKGKLLNSLYKIRRNYRKEGLLASSSRTSSRSSTASNDFDNECKFDFNELLKPLSGEETDNLPGIKEKLLWLRNSSDPIETVHIYWNETAKTRLQGLMSSDKTIAQYMDEYPALKKPTGYILIKEDFKVIYPQHNNKLFETFPLIKEKILALARKREAKDPLIKTILNALNEEQVLDYEETSAYVAFSILPYLLTPHTIRLKDSKEKGKPSWRPSKSEVKDGFLIEIKSCADLQKTVSDRKEKLSRLGVQCQPLVVSVNNTFGHNDYYVIVNETYFLLKSVTDAIDCCFKCYHSLNAKYSPECVALWTFIQKAFYHLNTPWDQRYVTVNTLLTDLEILQGEN